MKQFETWLNENVPEGSQVSCQMLIAMRQSVQNAYANANRTIDEAMEAVRTVKKARKDDESDVELPETPWPVSKVGKVSLPTPTRLMATKSVLKKPVKKDDISAEFYTWDDAPKEPEAVQPIFGGLFKDSENKIIPWSGTDPDQEC